MLLLLWLPDLAESLGHAKWFAANFFPVWAILDLVLNFGIYDWSVRRDVEFLDLIGNFYKFGMSAAIQYPLLYVSFEILKESRNKIKTTLRIFLSIPSVILVCELVASFVITFLYLQSILTDHLGYVAGFLANIFIVMPLTGCLFVVIGFIFCYPLKAIWKNEQYFLSFGKNKL